MNVRRLLATALLAIGCSTEPTDSAALHFVIPGFVITQPAIRGDTAFVAFQDGTVRAIHTADGRTLWTRLLNESVYGKRLLLVNDVLVVPATALHGLATSSGLVRWSYGESTGIATPAVSGETLFVASRTGTASAIDARTGRELWATALDEVLFSPSLGQGSVVYGARGSLGTGQTSPLGAGHLFVLDRATGVERWRHLIPDAANTPASGGAANSGVVLGDRIIVGTHSGRVLALELGDGGVIWERDAAPPNAGAYLAPPVLVGDQVVLSRGDGILESWDAAMGTVRWSVRTTSVLFTHPVRCGTLICVSNGRFFAIDTEGRIVWSYGGGSGPVFVSTPGVTADGLVLAGATVDVTMNQLRAFRPPLDLGPTSPN